MSTFLLSCHAPGNDTASGADTIDASTSSGDEPLDFTLDAHAWRAFADSFANFWNDSRRAAERAGDEENDNAHS